MPRSIHTVAALALLVLGQLACSGDTGPDAYGTFEAEDVTVAAQTTGQILRLDAVEGEALPAGAVAAVLDTVQLTLGRDRAAAQRRALEASRLETRSQREAIEAQLEIARRTWERTTRLRAGEAATAMQADQAERDVRVLTSQLDATRAAAVAVEAQIAATRAQVGQLEDWLAHATVTNPVAGTVLTTYVRAGEMIQPGQALYAIASLDTLTLRAYVSGTQLGSFRLGDAVTVHVEDPDGLRSYPGRVSWVSDRAEFTPTPVQTRDERATLVYAVKILVGNPDGRLKIGMPGDVTLSVPTTGQPSP
jgi:HlyD family secretion protein